MTQTRRNMAVLWLLVASLWIGAVVESGEAIVSKCLGQLEEFVATPIGDGYPVARADGQKSRCEAAVLVDNTVKQH